MLAKPSDPHVRVYCRVRPLSAAEASTGSRLCLALGPQGAHAGRKPDVQLGDRSWPFDGVFGPESSQTDVYAAAVGPLVDQCLAGYNATVLAYGQTGSGKTHTMGNTTPPIANHDADTPDEPPVAATAAHANPSHVTAVEDGVIPRALAELFRALDVKHDTGDVCGVRVRVSYLEIYNEEVRDLLRPSTPSRDLRVQGRSSSSAQSQGTGGGGRVDVAGALELEVTSAAEVKAAFVSGNAHRATAGTFMNAQSSRSHAVLTLHIEQEIPVAPPPSNDDFEDRAKDAATISAAKGRRRRFVRSKFHFVDLAGSERASRTGVSGMRLRESKGINQGLLALGKVISALATAHQRANSTLGGGNGGGGGTSGTGPIGGSFGHLHVPYRDSKLTRLLQDSLGGNSATAVIACVSPSDSNVGETVNTLKYASRARDIVNVAVVNVSTVEEVVEEEEQEEVHESDEGSGCDTDDDLQQDNDYRSGNEVGTRKNRIKRADLTQRISDLEAELKVAQSGVERGGDRRQRSAWAGRVAQLREKGYEHQRGGDGGELGLVEATSSEDAEALAQEVLIGRKVLMELKEALEAIAQHTDEYLRNVNDHGGAGDDNGNQAPTESSSDAARSRRVLSGKMKRLAERAGNAAQKPFTSFVEIRDNDNDGKSSQSSGVGSQDGAWSLTAKILELQGESSRHKARAEVAEAALAEAQKDLARDEEIFMDKLKELKAFEDKVATLEEALANQRASANNASNEVSLSSQKKKVKNQKQPRQRRPKHSEAWLPHEEEADDQDLYRIRNSRDQEGYSDAKAEAKMSYRNEAGDEGVIANPSTAATDAAAALAAAIQESEAIAQRAQEAQKAAEDASSRLQAARDKAGKATAEEDELVDDLREGRLAVASTEQSARDAQTAAEKAASVLGAAQARETRLLRHNSNNSNSPHNNTTTSRDDGDDANNNVDEVVSSSHAAVRAAREEAEKAEQATSLAAAELASAVAAEVSNTADGHRNSKALSSDIWDVNSAREDEKSFGDQVQAAAAALEEARNVAAALEERRRALQALETGSAEATALVRAYRDRVSNLHREVSVLMAVFQAKTRPELNECLQRVQSVCGVNTDIRSSSGAGSSQEQQQHKQLMGKLRQLLDSRSAELKILRAQEEEQRAVVALKRRADHREDTLRKEVIDLEQKSAAANARAADLRSRRSNRRNTTAQSSSSSSSSNSRLMVARSREQDARTALSVAQAHEAAAVAAWEQAAEIAVEADRNALEQARRAHVKAATVAEATREEANSCSARARRAQNALSVVERRWKTAQTATKDALQHVKECEVEAKGSADEVVHCAAQAAEAYAHVQGVKEKNAAAAAADDGVSSAEAKEAWPLQAQSRRGRRSRQRRGRDVDGERGSSDEKSESQFEGWSEDDRSSSECSYKEDGSDDDEVKEEKNGDVEHDDDNEEEDDEKEVLQGDDADSSQLLTSSASAWLLERLSDCEAAVLARRAFRRDLASRAHAEAARACAQERRARMVRQADLLAASRSGAGVSSGLGGAAGGAARSSQELPSSSSADVLRSSLESVSATVKALNSQMLSAEQQHNQYRKEGAGQSLILLEQKRAEALEARAALESAVQDAGRHEDALREADDELEALEAEIQYKDREIRRWEREEEAAAAAAAAASDSTKTNQVASLRFSSSASVFAGLATGSGSASGSGAAAGSSGSGNISGGDRSQKAIADTTNVESVDVATAVDRCIVAQLPTFLALENFSALSSSSSSSSSSSTPSSRGFELVKGGGKISAAQTPKKQQTLLRVSAMVAAAASACVCARLSQRDARGQALSAEQANTQAQESTTAMANALRQAQEEHGAATERLVSQLTAAAGNLKRVRKEREQLRVFLAAAADAHSTSTPSSGAGCAAEPKMNSGTNHNFDHKRHGNETRRIVRDQPERITGALGGESGNLLTSPVPLTSPASLSSSSTSSTSSHNPGNGMRRVRVSARALREVNGL